MKLFDKIKKYLRNRGLVIRNPIKQVKPQARKGNCQFFNYLEEEQSRAILEEAEQKARENALPHPNENEM